MIFKQIFVLQSTVLLYVSTFNWLLSYDYDYEYEYLKEDACTWYGLRTDRERNAILYFPLN